MRENLDFDWTKWSIHMNLTICSGDCTPWESTLMGLLQNISYPSWYLAFSLVIIKLNSPLEHPSISPDSQLYKLLYIYFGGWESMKNIFVFYTFIIFTNLLSVSWLIMEGGGALVLKCWFIYCLMRGGGQEKYVLYGCENVHNYGIPLNSRCSFLSEKKHNPKIRITYDFAIYSNY